MDIDKRSATSHELGLKYLEARHQEGLTVKDDDVRRHRMQVVLLQDENGRLKDQVSSLGDRVGSLTSQYDDAERQLEGLKHKCREQDGQLRAQAREHAALRTELLSLSSTTHDSTKVLTEKLALSRELAVLKPEVEHLRSQLTHQKDVLSEKLALERQLNALEVEFANEKRAAQRAAAAAAQRQQTTNDDNEAEEELRQQIQDLEKKLASEKRAREKMQREQEDARSTDTDKITKALEDEKRESLRAKKALETELAEARGQIDVFELRVGDLKSKLREVREELKGARAELAAAQDRPAHFAAAATAKEGIKKTKTAATAAGTTTTKVQTKGQKKRRAEEPSGPELLLQTPGVGNEGRTKRPLKKRGFDAAAVQKSTFSITPFLNKTSNPMDESADAAAAAPVAADKSKASAAEKSVADKSASVVESMMAESTIPGEESELPEDSIMGRRVSASATLSSVDITDSSSVGTAVKAAAQATEAGAKRRGRPPKEKILGDAPISKKNMKVQPAAVESKPVAADEPPFKKAPVEVAKAKEAAIDEPAAVEQENRPPHAASTTGAVAMKVKKNAAPVVAKAASEAEPKKKKRKILGASSKTVFDEDDDDGIDKEDGALARPIKPAASAASAAAPAGGAAVKRVVKTLGAGRAAAAGAGKRTMLGGMRNAFGGVGGRSFSPLKRDRRGVNASFLA